jgi:hypothetical protein
MFGAVRGLFAADANDNSPEGPGPSGSATQPGSSTTSDTQEAPDVFEPLPESKALPASAAGSSNLGSTDRRPARSNPKPLFKEDDGTDTGGPKRRRPLAQRQQFELTENDRAMETLGDALDYVNAAMDRQIERGQQEGFQPNESLSGDASARAAFYTLLPDQYQRNVFMRVAGSMHNWPRIRGLFGAPPYSFLRGDEGNMMRAAGIAHGRANMAHEDSQSASSYTQFGTGQLVDESEREYRVTPHETITTSDAAPWLLENGGKDIIMQCRVKKRDMKRKMEMLKDSESRKTLTFPRPGDRISLSPTPTMLSIQRRRSSNIESVAVVVRRVVPRGESAATALIVAQRL